MRFAIVITGFILLASACTGTGDVTHDSSTTTSSTTTTTTIAGSECRTGELPFVEDGVVAVLDSQGRDARAIGDLRWLPSDDCERIELTFLSEAGSPASSIGPVAVAIMPDAGIVRITLSEDIVDSAVADTKLNGGLVDRWFVVDGIGDGLVVDLHLGERVAARAFSTTSPGRVVIDLVPAGDDRPITGAVESGGIVLLSPRRGVGLYPLQITGYAAPDVDAVRIRLTDQLGVAIDRSISTLSPAFVWHAFRLTLDDGPSGAVDLFVGTVDENDEPIDGITVPLDLP